DGKLDGLYGPRTARALKAFEAQIGLPATGKLTPEIVEIIRQTPITAEPAKIELAPALTPAVETPVPPAAISAPAALTDAEPLPSPPPLLETFASAPPTGTETPAAAAAAEDAGGVTSLAMTSPADANGPTTRTVQTLSVRAPAAEPAAQQTA